jgi:hypothetical protein
VGTWRIVAFALRFPNGEVRHPAGPKPEGLLLYTPGGFMSVQVMDPSRLPFAVNDPRGATPEEALAACSGYIAYCGTYRVDDAAGVVIHEPDASLLPNWVGVPQRRYFRFDDNRLMLSGERPPAPDAPVQGLVWERVE